MMYDMNRTYGIGWRTSKYLELPYGVPSADTIRIVIGNIDTRHFYGIVISFLMDTMDKMLALGGVEESSLERDIIAVDGKESRGSKRAETDQEASKALHTLNAFSTNYGMCIGREFIPKKSNEIPAAPILLGQLDLKGSIVTWDVMNTQKDTVKAVIKGHGDYIGALKGNQEGFHIEVRCMKRIRKSIAKNSEEGIEKLFSLLNIDMVENQLNTGR